MNCTCFVVGITKEFFFRRVDIEELKIVTELAGLRVTMKDFRVSKLSHIFKPLDVK